MRPTLFSHKKVQRMQAYIILVHNPKLPLVMTSLYLYSEPYATNSSFVMFFWNLWTCFLTKPLNGHLVWLEKNVERCVKSIFPLFEFSCFFIFHHVNNKVFIYFLANSNRMVLNKKANLQYFPSSISPVLLDIATEINVFHTNFVIYQCFNR